MALQIALNHKTIYRYDRRINLGPQTVRLRPAPHTRTPILSYSLRVRPEKHFINWQQDPQSNYLARLMFPEPTTEFYVEVDLSPRWVSTIPLTFSWSRPLNSSPFPTNLFWLVNCVPI